MDNKENEKEQRKHLFHTTEKSDFIVNMTERQYQKLGFIYLALSAIVLFVMSIPYYVSKGALRYSFSGINALQTMKYVDFSRISSRCSGYISYLQIALYAVSFIGFLILIISATKKYFKAGENKLFVLPVIYLLFVVVSTFMAYDIKCAFFGKDYRYNGMLTLFSYIGLFVAASQINSRSRRKTYLDIFLTISLINAVYGILQTVSGLVEKVPNFFFDMLYINGNSTDSYAHYVADGLVHTPHALAALMTMAVAVAAAGLVYDKSKVRKVFCAVCVGTCAAAGFLSCTVAGYVGVPFALLTVLVIEIVRTTVFRKKSPKNKYGVLFAVVSIALAAAAFAIVALADRAYLYDSEIIWIDSAYRLGTAFPEYNGISGWHIYPRLWKECLNMLKSSWVLGGGPDCIGFGYYGTTLLYDSKLEFSTDRSYNEYFDLALACGVPCLLIYLSMGFVTIKKGLGCVKKFFLGEDSWTAAALLAAVLGYGLQANVNISIITVTPFFFVFVGLLWNRPHADTAATGKNSKKKERKIRK